MKSKSLKLYDRNSYEWHDNILESTGINRTANRGGPEHSNKFVFFLFSSQVPKTPESAKLKTIECKAI